MVAILAVMVVTTIGRPLIGLGSLHAADTLQVLDPWAQSAPEGFRPDNGMTSDTVDAVAPVRLAVAQRARDGDLALWSTSQGGGAPLLGIPNTAMLSPLNLPWWLAPGWWAPALAKLVQMLVAGGSLFLLARRLGLSRTASAVGAVAVVDAGFLVVWTTWPQSNVAALIPALFWAVDRAVVPGPVTGARSSPDPARPLGWAVAAIPLALVSASMWFEGFPALTLWAHLFAAAWALVRARSAGTGTVRATVATTLGMLTGLGIAAVQLVPFAFRVAELDTSTRAAKAADALPWETMATVLAPGAFGSAGAGVWYGPRNEVEVQAFLGASALALVVAAVVGGLRRRTGDLAGAAPASPVSAAVAWTRFAAAAVLVVGLLIWAGGPLHDAVQSLPVIGANQTGRLRGLLAVLLATLVAVGAEVVLRARPGERRLAVGIGVGSAVTLATLAPALLRARQAADLAGRGEFAARETTLPVVLFLAASVVLVLVVLVARPRLRTAGLGLVVVVLAVQAVTFARGFLPRIDRDQFYPRTMAHDVIDDLVGTNRFAAGEFAMYPGTTTVHGLHSVTAHAGMPAAWTAMLLDVDEQAYDRNGTFPILAATPEVAASPTLDLLGVSHFVTELRVPVFGERDPALAPMDRVDVGLPIHGVDVSRDVLRVLDDHDPPASLVAELLDDQGLPLASGRRRIDGRERADWLSVPLAPASPGAPPPTHGRIQLSVLLDPPGTPGAASRAGSGVDEGGISVAAPDGVQVRPVRAPDGGLRVVAAPDVVVYERPDALPRIRVEAPTASSVEVVARDDEDELTIEVTGAPAAATLVVADARSNGHRATVDGEPVEVTSAHEALVGVAIPPGDHEVRVWWEPQGVRPAAAITVLCLAAICLAGIAATIGTRGPRRERTAGQASGEGSEVVEQGAGTVGEGVAVQDGGASAP